MRIIRCLVALSGLAMLLVPGIYAQVTHDLQANIPFDFNVQETHLPAGTYIFRMMQDTDLNIMEIQSQDGKTSVEFQVDASQLPNTPAQSELFFHRYANKEYLTRVFTRRLSGRKPRSDDAIGIEDGEDRSEGGGAFSSCGYEVEGQKVRPQDRLRGSPAGISFRSAWSANIARTGKSRRGLPAPAPLY